MTHAFFKPIDFNALMLREVASPYVPHLADPTDTSHFEPQEVALSSPAKGTSSSEFGDFYFSKEG